MKTAHGFVVAYQGERIAAPPGEVSLIQEDAEHVRISGLFPRRQASHRVLQRPPALVRHTRSGTYLGFGRVQPSREPRGHGLSSESLSVAYQLDRHGRTPRVAEHVGLLGCRMREIHRLVGFLGGSLAQLIVPPGSFHRSDVQGLPRSSVAAPTRARATTAPPKNAMRSASRTASRTPSSSSPTGSTPDTATPPANPPSPPPSPETSSSTAKSRAKHYATNSPWKESPYDHNRD